jgi:hypothetical protein
MALTGTNALARPLYPGPAAFAYRQPVAVVAADFNNDGFIDLAVPGRDGRRVFLGDGQGDFVLGWEQTIDLQCQFSAATDDLDGDGNMDLVIARCSDIGIAVLLGNGDGSFAPEATHGPGVVRDAVIGDFNGDGLRDVAAAGEASGNFVVLGNGDGTFGPAIGFPGDVVYHAAVGDFDGDGLDDLALPALNGGTVDIPRNQGDGTFAVGGSYPVGDEPIGVATGHLDEDEFLDLVVTNRGSEDLSVLFGNGDGTFGPEQRYSLHIHPVGSWVDGVAIADLDGDGWQDLVGVGTSLQPALWIMLGTGGGQFSPAVFGDYGIWGSRQLAIADFDEDGVLDLARASWYADQVIWLLGRGDGTFVSGDFHGTHATEYPGGVAVAVGDLDGNGRSDLVQANWSTNDVSVLVADGAGTFAPESRFCVVDAPPPCPAGSHPRSLAIGELTSDSHLDLAVVNESSDTISILAGDGAGNFTFFFSLSVSAGAELSSVALGDLDDANGTDIVAVGPGSSLAFVFLNDGAGSFVPSVVVPPALGWEPESVTLAHLDGDAHLDMTVSNDSWDGAVAVMLGTGDGTFSAAPTVTTTAMSRPDDHAVGDLNGDEIPDLAVCHGNGSIHVFYGNGDGTFDPFTIVYLDWPPRRASAHLASLLITDANGDGNPDFVATGLYAVYVFLGNEDGTFEPEEEFSVVSHTEVAAGDFNLDGRIDLAVPATLVLLNQSGPTALTFSADGVTLVWPAVPGALTYDVYRGDMSLLVDDDDDGLPDSGYGICLTGLDDDARDTFFVDGDLPPSGDGFFYLMSVIDAGGDGGPGTTSAGLPRVPQLPCP